MEILGWLSAEVAVAMSDLIKETEPRMVVEIGVFGGRSLLCQAEALRDNKHGTIYGIDSWRTREMIESLSEGGPHAEWPQKRMDEIHQQCMSMIWEHQLEHHVVIIRSASQYCYQLFAPNSIDILYIDGGHTEQASCRDVYYYLPKVRPGGYVWFDDSNWSTTQKAIAMIGGMCDNVKDFGYSQLFQKR